MGREDDLRFFEQDRLAGSMRGKCQHYVITGTWGIGKTVLLRQMKLLAQKQGAWALLFLAVSIQKRKPCPENPKNRIEIEVDPPNG